MPGICTQVGAHCAPYLASEILETAERPETFAAMRPKPLAWQPVGCPRTAVERLTHRFRVETESIRLRRTVPNPSMDRSIGSAPIANGNPRKVMSPCAHCDL
jgi:hypothetical protein